MIQILTGHLLGVIVAFCVAKNTSPVEKSFFSVIFSMFVLLGFLYYQLFRSLKHGTIYWRGTIEQDERPGNFWVTQFCYSTLAGFFILSFFFNYF